MRSLAMAALLVASPAAAQTVEVIEYGTYVTSGDSPSPENKPDAVVELRTVHDPRFVTRTATIPGQLCARFGIRFVLRDSPVPVLPVTIHVTHPRLVAPDGRTSDEETWPQLLVPDAPSMAGFEFDQAWEVVPGTWTMAVEYGGRVLATQSFDVQDVPGGGGAGDGCLHLS